MSERPQTCSGIINMEETLIRRCDRRALWALPVDCKDDVTVCSSRNLLAHSWEQQWELSVDAFKCPDVDPLACTGKLRVSDVCLLARNSWCSGWRLLQSVIRGRYCARLFVYYSQGCVCRAELSHSEENSCVWKLR